MLQINAEIRISMDIPFSTAYMCVYTGSALPARLQLDVNKVCKYSWM